MSVRTFSPSYVSPLGLLVASLASTLFNIILDGRDLEVLGVLVDVEGLELAARAGAALGGHGSSDLGAWGSRGA